MSSDAASSFCFSHSYIDGAIYLSLVNDSCFTTFTGKRAFISAVAFFSFFFFLSFEYTFVVGCNDITDVLGCRVGYFYCVSVERRR